MLLALRIYKASEPADIVFYFKGLVTQQMREDNDKQYLNLGHAKQVATPCNMLLICLLSPILVICGEFFGLKCYPSKPLNIAILKIDTTNQII